MCRLSRASLCPITNPGFDHHRSGLVEAALREVSDRRLGSDMCRQTERAHMKYMLGRKPRLQTVATAVVLGVLPLAVIVAPSSEASSKAKRQAAEPLVQVCHAALGPAVDGQPSPVLDTGCFRATEAQADAYTETGIGAEAARRKKGPKARASATYDLALMWKDTQGNGSRYVFTTTSSCELNGRYFEATDFGNSSKWGVTWLNNNVESDVPSATFAQCYRNILFDNAQLTGDAANCDREDTIVGSTCWYGITSSMNNRASSARFKWGSGH